jgi:threonylcarbamoyladenosine tRNA methylthiotransferase MtaB
MLKKAARENPGARVELVGCLSRLKGLKISGIKSGHEQAGSDNLGRKGRYFIKVQDGCDQFCSYCVIPYVRGPLKSRQAGTIINELKSAARSGYRSAELCGIHLGKYGYDRGERDALPELIEGILSATDLKLRLSSIEITEVTDRLIGLLARERRLVRRLHLPLQSGSDRILAAMRRPYTAAEFLGRIKALLKALPGASLSTDVIVGFPGETEADFQATVDSVKLAGFAKVHVFPYSAQPFTAAASLPGQVTETIKKERAAMLRGLFASE